MKNLITLLAVVFTFATVGFAATPARTTAPAKKKAANVQMAKQMKDTTKAATVKHSAVRHKLAMKKHISKMHASAKSARSTKKSSKAGEKNTKNTKSANSSETKPSGTK